jgi:hypothetical protein
VLGQVARAAAARLAFLKTMVLDGAGMREWADRALGPGGLPTALSGLAWQARLLGLAEDGRSEQARAVLAAAERSGLGLSRADLLFLNGQVCLLCDEVRVLEDHTERVDTSGGSESSRGA